MTYIRRVWSKWRWQFYIIIHTSCLVPTTVSEQHTTRLQEILIKVFLQRKLLFSSVSVRLPVSLPIYLSQSNTHTHTHTVHKQLNMHRVNYALMSSNHNTVGIFLVSLSLSLWLTHTHMAHTHIYTIKHAQRQFTLQFKPQYNGCISCQFVSVFLSDSLTHTYAYTCIH